MIWPRRLRQRSQPLTILQFTGVLSDWEVAEITERWKQVAGNRPLLLLGDEITHTEVVPYYKGWKRAK